MRKTDRKDCADSKSLSHGLTQSQSSLLSKGHFYARIGLPFSKKVMICNNKTWSTNRIKKYTTDSMQQLM